MSNLCEDCGTDVGGCEACGYSGLSKELLYKLENYNEMEKSLLEAFKRDDEIEKEVKKLYIKYRKTIYMDGERLNELENKLKILLQKFWPDVN